MNTKIGPQCPSDTPKWKKRMRFHQSWFRSQVLSLNCGTGPYKSSTDFLGNMLTKGAAERGCNFLSPNIFKAVEHRLKHRQKGETLDRFRLMHNMLSSQPMCFNLFGELSCDLALATEVCRELLGKHVSKVIDVRFEWAPQPRQEFLNDRTAFDIFIEYNTVDQEKGFIGIETKLTEPFSPNTCCKPQYLELTQDSPWWDDPDVNKLMSRKFNQLWRNHLLSWAVLTHREFSYSRGNLMIIYHPCDEKCADTLTEYRKLVNSGREILSFNLEEIVSTLRSLMSSQAARRWIDDFEARYLRLDLSVEEFGASH